MLGACDDGGGGAEPTVLADGGAFAGAGACPANTSTCVGQEYRVCVGGRFVAQATCGADETCVPGTGCAGCDPGMPTFCEADQVIVCGADGRRGGVIETCDKGCANGACVGGCIEGNELIYVVDSDDDLHTFDPRTAQFQRRGRLACPAGAAWRDFGGGAASPFSMAVDRTGHAYVLYTSGELFRVDTQTLACVRTDFTPGDGGFELFGMGFVSDSPGRPEETLFIVGGRADDLGAGVLARVDLSTLRVVPVGPMPAAEYGAELTGNANAELFAYRPGGQSAVARLNRAQGGESMRWDLPQNREQPTAWAFAHWGGRYFVFITTRALGGDDTARVLRFDPNDGSTVTAADDTGRRVVGAGVSTCAPVVSNF